MAQAASDRPTNLPKTRNKSLLLILLFFITVMISVSLQKSFTLASESFEYEKAFQLLIQLLLITFFLERCIEFIVDFTRNQGIITKDNTKDITLSLSFCFGIIISRLAIRALGTVITPINQDWITVYIFNVLDITLTGCVIAGGSDAIHGFMKKMMQLKK